MNDDAILPLDPDLDDADLEADDDLLGIKPKVDAIADESLEELAEREDEEDEFDLDDDEM